MPLKNKKFCFWLIAAMILIILPSLYLNVCFAQSTDKSSSIRQSSDDVNTNGKSSGATQSSNDPDPASIQNIGVNSNGKSSGATQSSNDPTSVHDESSNVKKAKQDNQNFVPYENLDINTDPEGADVIYDGKNVGKTPITNTITDKNEHSIRVVKEGFKSVEVNYSPNSGKSIDISLNKTDEPTQNMIQTSTNTTQTSPNAKDAPGFLGTSSLVILLYVCLILRNNK